MSNYVWGSSLSYSDYLLAKSFVSDVKSATCDAGRKVLMDISRQTREIIASNESLRREHLELLNAETDRTVGALNDGFERISYSMGAGFNNLSDGIPELNATFHWGFGTILASIGHMNDTLSELVKIAKTPVQTLAFNHFEIARDAFRQGLYRESFEELDKAILGDHTSSGYKLEWRFHQMKGTLQLGFADCDMSLYDLAKAEDSFLTAARYGKTDYPHDAGRAFLSAGWAAYCQGKMKEALAYTEQARVLHPEMGEVFFQASKVHMALGNVDRALLLLAKAIDLSRFYALKAAGDGDFQPYDDRLRIVLEALRKEKYGQCVPKVKAVLDKIAPGTENRLQAFLEDGVDWPLMDMLEVVQNLDSFKHLPIIVRIKVLGNFVDTKEAYTEQETYYEDAVIMLGGFHKKAVIEKQKKTRMVTKTRTVTKSSPGEEIALFEFCPIPAQDYYMGKYPVTQQQWETVMGNNPSNFKGGSLPVEIVSWDDAQVFIQKLNQLSGKKLYRLPTEDEWEYACRASSTSEYYFGDDESQLGSYARYDVNCEYTTHAVVHKKPNEWGLYDMAGNVFEWTDSWYDSRRWYRVIRGGSWVMGGVSGTRRCRSAFRCGSSPSHRSSCVGFRLVFVP